MRAISAAVLVLAVLAAGPGLTACDDPLLGNQVTADTVTIAVPGAGLGVASAIDLLRIAPPYTLRRNPEQVGDAQQWDFALRRTEDGLALRPFSPVGPGRGAGIALASASYDALETAPRTVSAYRFETTEISEGATYVARSRPYGTGGGCVKYAKLQVVTLDVEAGSAHLKISINETCNDDRLSD